MKLNISEGIIRTKEKCLKCNGKFEHMRPKVRRFVKSIAKPEIEREAKTLKDARLMCPKCMTEPRRYFLDFYITGQGRLKIYTDRQGTPLTSYEQAKNILSVIHYEIHNNTFDPTKYSKSDLKNFLFEVQIEKWYQGKKKEVEKGNLSIRYTNELKRYIDTFYLPFFTDKNIDVRDIRTYHIQEFYNQLPSGKSLKYTKNIINALENFFITLQRHDIINHKPSFPIITLDRKAPKWIDRKTQYEVLKAVPDEDRPIFSFLVFQGLRPGEARALKVKDLDLENETMVISRTFSGSANILRERVKSKVVRPRAINPVLISLLQETIKDKLPDAYVFINPRTGTYYSESAIKKLWKKVKTATGVDVNLYQATRHSFATNAYKDGSDLKSIGDILGHTDIRTTLIYTHTDIDNQKAVFKKQQGVVLDFSGRVSPKTVPTLSPSKKDSEKNIGISNT